MSGRMDRCEYGRTRVAARFTVDNLRLTKPPETAYQGRFFFMKARFRVKNIRYFIRLSVENVFDMIVAWARLVREPGVERAKCQTGGISFHDGSFKYEHRK